MARSWKDVQAQANLDPTLVAEASAALEARIEGYSLAGARKRRSLTQRQVAELMQVSQARVSKIERGELHRAEVETLQAYIWHLQLRSFEGQRSPHDLSPRRSRALSHSRIRVGSR
jgi:predicted XRE-type DNA-binding protein